MYSATLPYLKKGTETLVFDIIKAEKILWWEYWSVADTKVFESYERSREVAFNFNILLLYTLQSEIKSCLNENNP